MLARRRPGRKPPGRRARTRPLSLTGRPASPSMRVCMGTSARLRCVRAHLEELYRNRALIANLVRREVVARYKRSVLGFLWTLLTPLMSLAVYWLIFTKVTAVVSVPNYAVFLFAGLLPWT